MEKEREIDLRFCDKVNSANYIMAWTFGCLLFSYLKDTTLVLKGEGENGEDLKICITRDWIKANEIPSLGLTSEDIEELIVCFDECEFPEIVELKEKYFLMQEGRLPGGDMLVWMRIFNFSRPDSRCCLSREESPDFGRAIDSLKPHLSCLLGENRALFSWPGAAQ